MTSEHTAFRSTVAALALAVSALILPSGAHSTLAATSVGAHCDSGDDLNVPLTDVDPGGLVTFTGTCIGNFTINKPMTIQGGTIQGSGGGPALTISPGSGNVTLQNLTITGGSGAAGAKGIPLIRDDGTAGGPGGLDIKNGTVTVSNTTITGNQGGRGGDGSADAVSKLKAVIGGNGGKGGAGGVEIEGGTVSFTNVTVSGNSGGEGGWGNGPAASAGYGGDAGADGMEIDGGSVTIAHSTITHNTDSGATIGVGGDSDTSPGSGGHGSTGGIQLSNGTVNVFNSTISNNEGGPGDQAGEGVLSSTFGTEGAGGAGGFLITGGSMNVYNSTVTGNQGGSGGTDPFAADAPFGHGGDGAATVLGGSLNVYYTTVSLNHTYSQGYPRGVEGLDNQGGTVTAFGSVLATTGHKGYSGENPEIDCSGTIGNSGYNVLGIFNFEGSGDNCIYQPQFPDPGTPAAASMYSDGTGIVLASGPPSPQRSALQLGPLQVGYNSTPLMPEGAGSGSIGLVPESVCDAGVPGPSGSGIPNTGGSGDLIFADERGISRAHRNCDAGAFQTLPTPTIDLFHDAADDTGISQSDDVTSNNRPTFKGQVLGSTRLTVSIYDNGQKLGTSVVGGTTGNNDFFFFRPSSALSDGVHTITATVQDPDSGQTVTSAPSTVTIETGRPNVYVVPKRQTVSSNGIYNPDAGGTTLTVTMGVSDPGGATALSCTDGTTTVASISNASASPQITQDVALKSGAHAISCTGTGAAGNNGSLTQSIFVTRTLSILVGGSTDSHGTTTLSAQLSDDGGKAVDGKTITFFVQNKSNPVNWIQVCGVTGQPACPSTQLFSSGGTIDGDAVLTGPSMPPGYAQQSTDATYPGAIKATFAGDAQDSAVSGTANLSVASTVGGMIFDCPTTEAALQNDVTHAGKLGTVNLYCTHDTTIPFTSPIALTTTTIQSYGPGRVTFDGGGQTQLFDIPSPAAGGGSEVTISHVTLQNGSVTGTQGGGAVEVDGGAYVTLAFDTFINNGPNDVANAGTLVVLESTFSNPGAALYNTGTASLEGDTLAGDSSFGSGNAAIVNGSGASLTLAGTIVAAAAGGRGANCAIAGDSTLNDRGYNLEWSGVGGTNTCGLTGGAEGPDISGKDPLLGPLQDNSSRISPETMALQPGSPAIDQIAINTTACVSGDNDERSVQRPQNGKCDIGAYEYIPTPAPTITSVAATAPFNAGQPVSANFTATLHDATNAPLYGRIVFFSVSDGHGNWTAACGDPGHVNCPTTDSNGVATLDGVDLTNTAASGDVNAGAYGGVVRAQITGDMTDNAATGTGDLNVAQAQNVVSLTFDSPTNPLPFQAYGNPGFDLTNFSSHSAGATVTFDSETTNVCATTPGSTFVRIVSVGTCTIRASAPGDVNHSDAIPVEASFAVNPRELVVAASGGQMIVGGTPPVITPIIDPASFVPGDTAATALAGSPDCSTTATSSSAPGQYTSTCTLGTLGSTKYSFTFVDGTVNVVRPTATITLDPSTLTPTYSGNPNAVTATTNPTGLPYAVTYTDAHGTVLTSPPSTSGVYTVSARITDPTQLTLPVTGTLVVHKAALVMTCDDQSVSSGGPIPTLTYKITGHFMGGDTSSVINGTPTCTTTATSSSTSGEYPIVANVSALSATNYDITRGPDGTLTINSNPTTLNVSPASGVYAGTATLSATLTSGQTGVAGETVTFSLNGTAVCGGSGQPACPTTDGNGIATLSGVSLAGISVGTYPASTSCDASTGVFAGFAGDSSNTNSSGCNTLTVGQAAQATLTVTGPTSGTYGQAYSLSSSGGNGAGAVTYDVGSSTACTIPTVGTQAGKLVITSGTGTCTVTAKKAAETNYAGTTSAPASVPVSKATLTITPTHDPVNYGDPVPTGGWGYTPSGFVGSDSVTSTTITGSPSGCTTSYVVGDSAGSAQTITCTDVSSMSAANYNFTLASGTLTVAPGPVTVTAPSPTMTYGDTTLPSLAPSSVTGLANGAAFSSLGGSCSALSNTGTPTAFTVSSSTVPGTYTVRCSGLTSQNYSVTYIDGSLTVKRASLSVAAPQATMTYGDAILPGLAPTPTGLKNSDTFSGVGGTCSPLTGGATPFTLSSSTNAGTYTVRCSGVDTTKYSTTYTDGSLVIKQAPLTITASSGSMTYGGTVPTITPQYATFAGADTAASLTTAPTCNTVATGSSSVGRYTSSCSGAVDSNYTITYMAGSVQVAPAVLTVAAPNASVQYSDPVPSLVPTISGYVLRQGASALTTAPTCAGTVPTGPFTNAAGTTRTTGVTSSAGATYAITCSGGSATNYTFDYTSSAHYTPGVLTVSQENATVQLSAGPSAQVLGTGPITLTATVRDSAAGGYSGTNGESSTNGTVGDVTKTFVEFDIYNAATCLSGTPAMSPVVSVTSSTRGVGTAIYSLASPTTETSYCVVPRVVAGPATAAGFGVNGANPYYTASPGSVTGVAFYQNTGQFATGGGWIADSSSSTGLGTLSFSARYTKSGGAKGQIAYVWQGTYNGQLANFTITSNALSSLSFTGSGSSFTATLQGKCAESIVAVATGQQLFSQGNLSFTATAKDGDYGLSQNIPSDAFSFSVFNSSNTAIKQVTATPLSGGNLVVHNA